MVEHSGRSLLRVGDAVGVEVAGVVGVCRRLPVWFSFCLEPAGLRGFQHSALILHSLTFIMAANHWLQW
jgi:hypothetical protein